MAEGYSSAAVSPWDSILMRIVGLLMELESLRQQIAVLNSSIDDLVDRFDFFGRRSSSSSQELSNLTRREAMEDEPAIDTYNEGQRKMLSESEVSKRLEEIETVRVGSRCSEEEAEVCAICMEGFELGCEAKILGCSHLYHTDCIGGWMAYKNLCPLCRCNVY